MPYIGKQPTPVPITTSDLDDDIVSLAKMAGLARGKLIYGDTSGDPAALAVGGANEVLTHDGTDFDWAAAGGGKLLQVVYNSDTAQNDNATTDYANGVGASVAITPTSASSTLYIMCTGSFGTTSGTTNYNQNLNVQIYDLTNTTGILTKTSATNIFDDGAGNSFYAQTQGSYTASVAASDTVARTYQLRFAMNAVTFTRTSRSSNSQMTIFEVGA